MVDRTCLNCGAFFQQGDTLDRLIKHQEKCTKEKPLLNDENADGYEEELLN